MKSSARILADSISLSGHRLTTMEVVIPRPVLAEFNTHRVLSRNSASMRAIPVHKIIAAVKDDPYIPSAFSVNDKGMAAKEFIRPGDAAWRPSVNWWLDARDKMLDSAQEGLEAGLHKQVVNRLLEPWSWQTIIVSSTEWENYRALRTAVDDEGNPLADLAIYEPSVAMMDALDNSIPQLVQYGEWKHLPLTGFPGDESLSVDDLRRVSVARCARVSYLTHAGVRDVEQDLKLYDRLSNNGHLSPFEHVATPSDYRSDWANFTGWIQERRFIERRNLSQNDLLG